MTTIVKERKWFTSFDLKVLALLFMTLDHIEYFLNIQGVLKPPSFFGLLGRIAAPLFIFCMAQGFHYTHSKGAYLWRLYLASVLMNFTNGLVERVFPHPDGAMIINAIFGTLFLIGAYCWLLEYLSSSIKKKDTGKTAVAVLLMLLPLLADGLKLFMMSQPQWLQGNGLIAFRLITGLLPSPIMAEGSIFWVALGVGMYFLRDKKKGLCIFYLLVSGYFLISALQAEASLVNLFVINQQWFMVFALPFMMLYNGKRGRSMKYLFYLYYPGHIYILAALAYMLG